MAQARTLRSALERIKFSRNHHAVPSKLVNPLYINKLEQILRVDGSLSVIPINPDLL